jgi:hypothetical protein
LPGLEHWESKKGWVAVIETMSQDWALVILMMVTQAGNNTDEMKLALAR